MTNISTSASVLIPRPREEEGGTRIVWTYTFGLTSPLAYPLAIPIVRLFNGWLQQGLDAIRAELLT